MFSVQCVRRAGGRVRVKYEGERFVARVVGLVRQVGLGERLGLNTEY